MPMRTSKRPSKSSGVCFVVVVIPNPQASQIATISNKVAQRPVWEAKLENV